MIWVQTASISSSWSWLSRKNSAVEIPDDAAEKILTVKDAIDFIGANQKG